MSLPSSHPDLREIRRKLAQEAAERAERDAKGEPWDFSRLLPHDGRTASARRSTPDDSPIDSSTKDLLTPSSDLTILLSDTDIKKRYREGRYHPGENVMLRIPYFPPCISITASHLAKKCSPKSVGVSVILSAALHVGMLHISKWESVRRISCAVDEFKSASPSLSSGAISGFEATRENYQPTALNRGRVNLVISHGREEELSALTGKTCLLSNGRLAAYCIMLTLSRQPEKYLNPVFMAELVEKAREIWQWLNHKADVMESALVTFGTFKSDASF